MVLLFFLSFFLDSVILSDFAFFWSQFCIYSSMMMNSTNVYRKSKVLGGFALKVNDNIGYSIKYVHLTENALFTYLKEFGNTILKESDFLDWWCQLNQSKSC